MSYKVLDVCRYVIDYSNEKEYGISNLKLQKILYFIQAYFLIKQPSRCCFDDRIEDSLTSAVSVQKFPLLRISSAKYNMSA